jgi:hypothetical protein
LHSSTLGPWRSGPAQDRRAPPQERLRIRVGRAGSRRRAP